MSQYYAHQFYGKTVVVGFHNATSYDFWIINDLIDDSSSCTDCQLNLTSWSWSTGKVKEWSVSFSTTASDAKMIYSIAKSSFLKESGCSSETDCVLSWVASFGNDVITSNWMFIGSPKDSVSKDPKLKINKIESGYDEQQYVITVHSEGVAVFVWLETLLDGYFSDNGFLNPPGERVVVFQSRNPDTTLDDVQKGVYIYSLYDAGGFKK